jgi:uncharacterized Zn finger protein
MSTETTVLTEGQKRMRVTFNPNQDEHVVAIKNAYANLWDELETLRDVKLATEGKDQAWKQRTAREFSIALADTENACMYAVKGLTAHFQD